MKVPSLSTPLSIIICLLLIACDFLHAQEGKEYSTFPPLPFDFKKGETLSASENWILLNEEAGTQAVKQGKHIVLMMANNARFRSRAVAAYPEPLALTARWLITNNKGAMGFGWIDFSTSQYYYLYEDISRNELILQRGDGVRTKQLALYPLPASSTPRTFSLIRQSSAKGGAQITILVDGTPAGEPVIDQPEKELGSTFQIYVGSGNEAEVTLLEISTIPTTSRKKGGSWFW